MDLIKREDALRVVNAYDYRGVNLGMVKAQREIDATERWIRERTEQTEE